MPTLHQELILDINTDCAEFCPDPAQPDLLAVGTYQLDEATSTRAGVLHIYSLLHDPAPRLALHALQSTVGIFDSKWCRQQGEWRVSMALANGCLDIVRLREVRSASQGIGGGGVRRRAGALWAAGWRAQPPPVLLNRRHSFTVRPATALVSSFGLICIF